MVREPNNILRLPKKEIDSEETIEKIVRECQIMVTAEIHVEEARKRLIELLEQYTGRHWTKWEL